MTKPSTGTRGRGLSRRTALAVGMGGAVASAVSPAFAESPSPPPLRPAATLLPGRRRWLGPGLWGNRLQDWFAAEGSVVCRPMRGKRDLSTASLLTLEILPERGLGHLSVALEAQEGADDRSFGGFLIGAGAGLLDYRGAALVQAYSGRGGGFLAVVDYKGRLAFREHADERGSARFGTMQSTTVKAFEGSSLPAGATLHLNIASSAAAGIFELRLSLRNRAAELLAEELMTGLKRERLAGGVMLAAGSAGADGGWRFSVPSVGGDLFAVRANRQMGPIVACLHSLADGVLKMGVQCVPLNSEVPTVAHLRVRRRKGAWRTVASAPVEDATAQLRVENWESSRSAEYRVDVTVAGVRFSQGGTIRAEPRDRPLRIGLFSCVAATLRALDGPPEQLELPQASPTGRFDPNSIIFPHLDLIRSAERQKPDILAICGDQFYEHFPTRGMDDADANENVEEVCLDSIYKWLLWCWAFRDLVADRPAIVLMDDHDYYQPNYWGNGGRAAPDGDRNRGGYTKPVRYIRMIERAETGHNPDPHDPTPVDQGIAAYYGAFRYGGVSFAFLEDRKFKTGIFQGDDLDVYEGQLLGARQEAFLRAWKVMHPGLPKVVLTQTVWACPQTTPGGAPLVDFDSNGFPSYSRRVAVQLVKDCRAMILSGDQHMASLLRHGIDDYQDGPLQFTGPAGGVGWQRWFEPAGSLPNARPGVPNTGDFIDG